MSTPDYAAILEWNDASEVAIRREALNGVLDELRGGLTRICAEEKAALIAAKKSGDHSRYSFLHMQANIQRIGVVAMWNALGAAARNISW